MKQMMSKMVLGCACYLIVAPVICFSASAQETSPASKSWRSIEADVVYGHKAGMALTYDRIEPTAEKKNGAGVLFMVSGGWNSRWYDPRSTVRENRPRQMNLFEKLVDNGFTVYLVRHGSAPRFKVPEAVADVRNAIRHIRLKAAGHGIDRDRIGVCGGSAGGHLSLMLGTTGKDGKESPRNMREAGTRVAAVVAYFPPTDLTGLMNDERLVKQFPALDFESSKASSVSPIKQVTEDDAPTLLIHGDKDRLVKLKHSEKIKVEFDAKKVINDLIVIKGAAHGFRGKDQQTAESALVAWFKKHLAKKKSAETHSPD